MQTSIIDLWKYTLRKKSRAERSNMVPFQLCTPSDQSAKIHLLNNTLHYRIQQFSVQPFFPEFEISHYKPKCPILIYCLDFFFLMGVDIIFSSNVANIRLKYGPEPNHTCKKTITHHTIQLTWRPLNSAFHLVNRVQQIWEQVITRVRSNEKPLNRHRFHSKFQDLKGSRG